MNGETGDNVKCSYINAESFSLGGGLGSPRMIMHTAQSASQLIPCHRRIGRRSNPSSFPEHGMAPIIWNSVKQFCDATRRIQEHDTIADYVRDFGRVLDWLAEGLQGWRTLPVEVRLAQPG